MSIQLTEFGTGSPLLLLHGFAGSARAWDPALLESLALEHRVLAVDLPGHGSSASAGADGYGFSQLVNDLESALEGVGVERCDVVGYSMGGRVALALALERPERVRRLVLESASPGLAEEVDRQVRRARDEELARRIVEEGIEWFSDHWEALPLFASRTTLPEDRLRAQREARLASNPLGLAWALRTLGTGSQPSYWERLGEGIQPVLLLAGELDPRFVATAEAMARSVPDVTVRIAPGAGHTVHVEAPDFWLRSVKGFLSD